MVPATGAGREHALRRDESQRDAVAAMNHLDAEFAPAGYVFAGLCSGAYLSFHTAVSDPRVSALILINIVTFRWEPGDTVEAYIQRQFKGTAFYLRAWRDPCRLAAGVAGRSQCPWHRRQRDAPYRGAQRDLPDTHRDWQQFRGAPRVQAPHRARGVDLPGVRR